jgi:ankyrin repeat protein
MSKMAETTLANDAKELLSLCRAGRLYDVEKWIAEGKSLELPASKNRKNKSLLQVAVETGFHSLVELIAKHDKCESSQSAALEAAASIRRLDLVELLLANGAKITCVPLADVLLGWEPKIIRFFLDHGADAVTGSPFAVAFGAKIRTALRPFLEYKQAHPDLAPAMQEQLDCALRHFCYEGDLKWVNLLIWAGGDARSLGPSLEKEYTTDPECYTSGLQEACYSGKVDVLKKLKPEAGRDDLSDLLHCAAISGERDTLRYLLEVGANPNDKPGGGSSALDTALWHLNTFRRYNDSGLRSKYELYKPLDCIRELLAHGGVWNPDQYHVNSLRRILLECEPEVTIELLQLFRKHNACPAEQVHKLLRAPRMKEHLAQQIPQLSRLGLALQDNRSSKTRAIPAERRRLRIFQSHLTL